MVEGVAYLSGAVGYEDPTSVGGRFLFTPVISSENYITGFVFARISTSPVHRPALGAFFDSTSGGSSQIREQVLFVFQPRHNQ